jgi:hypothetical protein
MLKRFFKATRRVFLYEFVLIDTSDPELTVNGRSIDRSILAGQRVIATAAEFGEACENYLATDGSRMIPNNQFKLGRNGYLAVLMIAGLMAGIFFELWREAVENPPRNSPDSENRDTNGHATPKPVFPRRICV